MTKLRAFVGTYTDGDSDGVYSCTVDTGQKSVLTRTGSTAVLDNPSYLALHPTADYLYAVHEVSEGEVTALQIGEEGTLRKTNRVGSGAAGPCHCSVHPSGEFLFIAHYTGGAVSVLPIDDRGELRKPTTTVGHTGSSINPDRQSEPHPHSMTPGPNGRFVYVPDLGTDEIVVYELDEANGSLERVSEVDVQAGAGPRHLSFHPDEPFAFVINELDSTVTSLQWDDQSGSLTVVDRTSTLPADMDVENYTSDIHVHPSGQWVYGTNRGHDSIATFAVDSETGELDAVDWTPTGGEWPRHFALTPAGEFLFAENQHSDQITVFRLDTETGIPTATDERLHVPEPVCLKIQESLS